MATYLRRAVTYFVDCDEKRKKVHLVVTSGNSHPATIKAKWKSSGEDLFEPVSGKNVSKPIATNSKLGEKNDRLIVTVVVSRIANLEKPVKIKIGLRGGVEDKEWAEPSHDENKVTVGRVFIFRCAE